MMSKNLSETRQDPLSTLETLRLGAAHAYYSVSRALRLDKVATLLQRAELAVDIPVALLGTRYSPKDAFNDAAAQEILSQLVHHFHSTVWMTYRNDFTPLPVGDTGKQLTTDAGWGCTLRTVQMIAAQALVRHTLGSQWRLPLPVDHEEEKQEEEEEEEEEGEEGGSIGSEKGESGPEGLRAVLQLFWDCPVQSSPLSIHNLCLHGASCGIFPGRWLGPWTGCRALEAAAAAATPPTLLRGLQISVLGGSGGGAPILHRDRFLSKFSLTSEEENSCALEDAESSQPRGLLLLIPLVLGLDKLNPVYVPQLRAVLSMPQSVGVVGGRPSSSLYLVGCQGDAILYLDPHTIQPAARSDANWSTFSCDVLRTLRLPNVDPSLALGFYCGSEGEYSDLCARLEALEAQNVGSPLVCVREGKNGNDDDCGGGGDGSLYVGGQDEQEWEKDDDDDEDDIEIERSRSCSISEDAEVGEEEEEKEVIDEKESIEAVAVPIDRNREMAIEEEQEEEVVELIVESKFEEMAVTAAALATDRDAEEEEKDEVENGGEEDEELLFAGGGGNEHHQTRFNENNAGNCRVEGEKEEEEEEEECVVLVERLNSGLRPASSTKSAWELI